ncbi:MAG TPA: nucleotide exchange factor GrpE [Nitrososphaeraceae archaeon]|jgi:molecular chaperone GrpE|nr:nucleotide exchange factor GrpE [Nitrososphaeraceae archaeon]
MYEKTENGDDRLNSEITENEVLNKDNNGDDRLNSEITENEVLNKDNNGDDILNSEITENEVLNREIEFLKGELEKEKEVSDKNLSKLRYLMADFDNYRKQIEKQMESKIEENRGHLFIKILKIYDDCILALETLKNGKYDSTVIGGIKGIMTNFEAFMKDEGLVEIETMGTPFDPNVHDAIGFVSNELVPDNTIMEVVRKGYLLNNKVLRPSSVILSKRTVTNKDINEKDKE